jgi:FkbM family methyltransferase
MTAIATSERVAEFRTPRGRPALMTIRDGTNDWNTLNACMTEDEYQLRSFNGNGWALDIGGYLGGVGIGLALDNPGLRVLIVEPVPDNIRLIKDNIARNGVGDRVTLIEGAIGDGGPVEVWHGYQGTVTAEHHRFVGNSSLAYDHGGELQHDTTTYESLTLADLLNIIDASGTVTKWQDRWTRIDLIKIDCEGGEWEFLASPETWKAHLILGEAHATRGHRGDDIVPLLEAAAFDVTVIGDGAGTCEFRAVSNAKGVAA